MAQPSKREVMQALLERAEARVHLDARRDGVLLPERLRSDGHVRLDYGYGFQPPIPDLVIDDDGIHATLSFNRVPFRTFVPWSAIYLIADFDGNGAVWQEDIPVDLLDVAEPGAGEKSASPSASPSPTDDQPPPDPPKPGKKPRPSHLKLVK
ncbi:MAG TPA: ClpXP protease specificity-enhancing factor SspB [Polyangia bacterium]|nr:ClpXP protease specificity-enhancing factor SspB [Polyangia bacterium]